MVQILFGIGYDDSNSSVLFDALRALLSTLDKAVYISIGWVYNLLFTIADTTILKADFLKDFYLRFQLIIGVIMVFKVSISLLQYVVNPEAFSDKKNGFGQVITRIIIVLVMLSAIIPLDIPESQIKENSYNDYLNQHGLLFGTLYSLQHRILSNNTIFKLVLGNTTGDLDVGNNEETDNSEQYNLQSVDSTVGEKFATYMLKGFISINVHSDKLDNDTMENSDYMCSPSAEVLDNDFIKNIVKGYASSTGYAVGLALSNPIFLPAIPIMTVVGLFQEMENNHEKMGYYYHIWSNATTPSEVIQLVNVACKEDKNYGFAYMPVISTICGVILLVLIGVYCIDVAVRTLKLAVLQLIAPIAIISYIDPKSNEKGAFSNWCRLLISTYLDLFLRLAIFAFISFLCLEIVTGGLNIQLKGLYNFFANVFIILGLFFFAKQAPKFISDALGLKGLGAGIGISGILGAAGAIAGGGGLAGAMSGFIGSANDASNAAAQGKQAPSAFATQRANMAKMITGDDKNDGSMGYRMQKAFHDMAGASAFNRLYGINASTLGAAKNKMYSLQDKAAEAKNAYDNFMRNGDINAAWNALSQKEQQNYDFDDKTGTLMDHDGKLVDMGNLLEKRYLNAESTAGKAKADFEKMQKIGDRANILMTPEQEHRASLTDRISDRYDAIRQPIQHAVDTRRAHQTIGQRSIGNANRNRNGDITGFSSNKFTIERGQGYYDDEQQ